MTTHETIAVSLPRGVLEAARAAVAEGAASSLSGYIADALARRQRQDELDEVLAAIIVDYGTPSPEDRAWVEQVLAR